jgi:hypothetical protein
MIRYKLNIDIMQKSFAEKAGLFKKEKKLIEFR